ncbi:MAG: hypothetical protein LC802_20955 [Acidobacteria bacterium]|nr:hypothetical protein [Acidobacteriota bacterium]
MSKTSFKTNTERSDDDEAFAGLRLAMKEATGREIKPYALVELDELLAIEFKIAASRTTVSNAPAFLAEHLRTGILIAPLIFLVLDSENASGRRHAMSAHFSCHRTSGSVAQGTRARSL